MSSTNANGKVSFMVDGIPQGVKFDSYRIIVSNDAAAGNHILKIKATDSLGNVSYKIVNLGVVVTYKA